MCCVLITFAVMMPGLNIEKAAMKDVFLPALTPLFGETLSTLLIGAILVGSSMLSAMVISLGVAWNLTEGTGGTLSAKEATTSSTFRAFFLGTVLLGVLVVDSGIIGIVELNIAVQLVDGIIMPIV